MPPPLVLCIALALVAWALRVDLKWRPLHAWVLLIPGVWLLIRSTRPVAYWFGVGDAVSDGGVINFIVTAALILSALFYSLRHPHVWRHLTEQNKLLLLAYLFFAGSSLWSEISFESAKRTLKDFGTVLVVLVIAAQPNPLLAVRTLAVRCAIFVFPLSIVVIKYYPHIGRMFSNRGEPMFTGLTTHKNTLGQVVITLGMFIVWDTFREWRQTRFAGVPNVLRIRLALIVLGGWLLVLSNSKTALACAIAGAALYYVLSRILRKGWRRLAVALLFVGITAGAVADRATGLSQHIIEAMGRDMTLTGRTEIWRKVSATHTGHLLGMGYMAFWDSEAGRQALETIGDDIKTAHNGFLEVYLDGGMVGVSLLVALLVFIWWRAVNRAIVGDVWGRLVLVIWSISVMYNFSESSFFRLGILWLFLLIATICMPFEEPESE